MDTIESEIDCHLTDLLYYDSTQKRHGNLQKGLREHQFLFLALSQAVRHLQEKDLEKFDALVSENACQNKVSKIVSIISRNLFEYKALEDFTTENKMMVL
jgi:hypothetical protein